MFLRLIIGFLRKLLYYWNWRIVPYVSCLLSRGISPVQHVYSWPEGPAKLGPRVALFVHFDAKGEVRPFVQHYVRSLHEAGCSVVFVSNAGTLRPDAMEAIKPFCDGILVRRNIGYDFAAMREGLSHFNLPRPETEMLVIANDSVYGPLQPLGDLFSRINFNKADFWGATESWQSRYHLQSFFMVAGPRLLNHPAWASFWANVRPVLSKRYIISRYEIGITQWMLKAGITCAAVWPYDDLINDTVTKWRDADKKSEADQNDPLSLMRTKHSFRIRSGYALRKALNPTSDLWQQLLVAGFPFIKRELLRENPTLVANVIDWRRVVASTSQADTSYIDRDLQRQMRNRAP